MVGRPLRLDRRAALDLLRRIASDRGDMLALRRLYAQEVGRSAVHTQRDDVILAHLAELIASGVLTASVFRRPEHGAPPELGQADAGAEQSEAAAAATEEEPTATISNPRWSVDRVKVGAEVEASFTYSGFVDDKSVTVNIYECDNNKPRNKVATVDVTVEHESGDHTFKWKRDAKKAQQDLEEDQAEGDSRPLEYVFEAEAKGVGHSGFSGTLWLTNTVTVKLTNEADGKAHEKPRIVVLLDYEREQRKWSENGKVTFDDVLVGPVEIRLAEPRFTRLGWTKEKVSVGEPVEAVFQYEDAIGGMKVSAVIHEFDADGSTTLVKRFDDIELEGDTGEVRLSFTRTEDEVNADLAEDEQAGDTGPLEYRYYVMAEDVRVSAASEHLWLTNTITVKLEDHEGKMFGGPRILVLRDAIGEEQRAESKDGEAAFKNVLVGPIDISVEEI